MTNFETFEQNEIKETVANITGKLEKYQDHYTQRLINIFTTYAKEGCFADMYENVRLAGQLNQKRFVQLWDIATRNLFLRLIYPD